MSSVSNVNDLEAVFIKLRTSKLENGKWIPRTKVNANMPDIFIMSVN